MGGCGGCGYGRVGGCRGTPIGRVGAEGHRRRGRARLISVVLRCETIVSCTFLPQGFHGFVTLPSFLLCVGVGVSDIILTGFTGPEGKLCGRHAVGVAVTAKYGRYVPP